MSITSLDRATDLSDEQKAGLGSGADFWSTKETGDIHSVSMADGPHGLRQQDITQGADHLGIRPAITATCFPPAVGLAQTWNPEPVRKVAAALAREAQAAGVNVLLGPGINIKRDPRGGRNFEYYSEDPYLTGVLASAWVDELQRGGVGASLKHFAANNQEHDRMRASSDIAARPLREIYLRAFQRVVQTAKPWTVMCSYNRLNGVYTAENRWLLSDVLRGEWGFDGVVVSDWGAVADRVASVRAGLDLEMPAGDGENDKKVLAALRDGSLDASLVDESVARLALLARRADAAARPGATWDVDEHHALAREIAGQAIVLLQNDDALLPLAPAARIAVVGEFAAAARYQGGGSSHVNSTRVDVPLEEIRALATGEVAFEPGFTTDGAGDESALRAAAVDVAAAADVAVVFLGLGERQESEGFDRDDIELPADQIALLEAVAAVQSRVVVVLSHGGALRLGPVVASATAILDAALLGQAAGGAIADALFGVVNPSGRLAETAPVRIQDVPAFLDFPGEASHVRYGEGLFVGYRWYDRRELEVQFPFGHGLSYTTFEHSGLEVERGEGEIVVRLEVRNTGERAGTEIVQVYVGRETSEVARAPRELRAFQAVELGVGEAAAVELRIAREDLAYWNEQVSAWLVEDGEYVVAVGASSRDLRQSATVSIDGDPIVLRLTRESTVGEVMGNPAAAAVFGAALAAVFGQAEEGVAADSGIDMVRMIGSFPIGRFIGSLGGQISLEQLDGILAEANASVGAE